MAFSTSLSLLNILLIATASASPLLNTKPISPSKPYLVNRSPASAATSQDDWPSNVVMVGGAETYGMWVPQDGNWYSTSSISCLDVPAYNIVNCGAVTIDNAGVVSGYGPCTLVGSTGWQATLNGASGYTTVGPPQTIISVQCAADS